ncbi:MAG: hypothetical protein JRI44_08550 [Deltaproteobacteria bacterium]|nr:hypothetical protein [Deltaproteobacteria bacterium]
MLLFIVLKILAGGGVTYFLIKGYPFIEILLLLAVTTAIFLYFTKKIGFPILVEAIYFMTGSFAIGLSFYGVVPSSSLIPSFFRHFRTFLTTFGIAITIQLIMAFLLSDYIKKRAEGFYKRLFNNDGSPLLWIYMISSFFLPAFFIIYSFSILKIMKIGLDVISISMVLGIIAEAVIRKRIFYYIKTHDPTFFSKASS